MRKFDYGNWKIEDDGLLHIKGHIPGSGANPETGSHLLAKIPIPLPDGEKYGFEIPLNSKTLVSKIQKAIEKQDRLIQKVASLRRKLEARRQRTGEGRG